MPHCWHRRAQELRVLDWFDGQVGRHHDLHHLRLSIARLAGLVPQADLESGNVSTTCFLECTHSYQTLERVHKHTRFGIRELRGSEGLEFLTSMKRDEMGHARSYNLPHSIIYHKSRISLLVFLG